MIRAMELVVLRSGPPPNSAKLCRLRGWGPGTVLVGDAGRGPTIIRLTAVGETSVLARRVSHNGRATRSNETTWSLLDREWRELDTTEGGA